MAIFMAWGGEFKDEIRRAVQEQLGCDLKRSAANIRETYQFYESCQGTVPVAIPAFLDSTDYEDAIRLAISMEGDSDTLAASAAELPPRSTQACLPTSWRPPWRC